MDPEQFDQCSRQGATRLAKSIFNYWSKRGFKIETDIRASQPPKHYVWKDGRAAIASEPFYTVVSNIGANGYPPRE